MQIRIRIQLPKILRIWICNPGIPSSFLHNMNCATLMLLRHANLSLLTIYCFTLYKGCIQRKLSMGPYRVDYNSTYLIVNSLVSYPPPLQREKGRSGEDLSYWLSTFVTAYLLISKTGIYVNTSTEKGEGRDKSCPYVFEKHFMEHGQPHA
jgi:hypothetical protein